MSRERYTAAQVAEALRRGRGIKRYAADALHCSQTTITNYIERHASVREAYEEAREILLDRAEARLTAAVDAGEWEAVKYTLETLGKERGYTERDEPDLRPTNEEEFLDFRESVRKVYGDKPSADPSQPSADGRSAAAGR